MVLSFVLRPDSSQVQRSSIASMLRALKAVGTNQVRQPPSDLDRPEIAGGRLAVRQTAEILKMNYGIKKL
jgi:hypothetical protein